MRIWSECFFCNIGRILEYMLKRKVCACESCVLIFYCLGTLLISAYVEVESLGTLIESGLPRASWQIERRRALTIRDIFMLSLCEQADLALCELMWNILAVIESH